MCVQHGYALLICLPTDDEHWLNAQRLQGKAGCSYAIEEAEAHDGKVACEVAGKVCDAVCPVTPSPGRKGRAGIKFGSPSLRRRSCKTSRPSMTPSCSPRRTSTNNNDGVIPKDIPARARAKEAARHGNGNNNHGRRPGSHPHSRHSPPSQWYLCRACQSWQVSSGHNNSRHSGIHNTRLRRRNSTTTHSHAKARRKDGKGHKGKGKGKAQH